MLSYIPTLFNLIFRPHSVFEYVEDPAYQKHWRFVLIAVGLFCVALNAWGSAAFPIIHEERLARNQLPWPIGATIDKLFQLIILFFGLLMSFYGVYIVASSKKDAPGTGRRYLKMSCLVYGLVLSVQAIGLGALLAGWKIGLISNPAVYKVFPAWLEIVWHCAVLVYLTTVQARFWSKGFFAAIGLSIKGIVVGTIAAFILVVVVPIQWIAKKLFDINL
jgi:hypothetical protein